MKKVLALVLASVMAVGMGATTFAADNWMADTQAYPLGLCTSEGNQGDSYSFSDDVRPSDDVEFDMFLTYELFKGNLKGTPGGSGDMLMTTKDIRNSKMVVRTSVSAGSKSYESVELVNKDSKITVKFVEEYVSTSDLDFDFTVYLVLDGKRQNDMGLTLTGTLANYVQDVYDEEDYVDLSYGTVAEAHDFINPIEVDLGNGISIHTKFFKGKKYYGTSSRDADAADDIVFSQYPDIDNVVTLKTVGLNSTGDIVKMDVDYNDYYVYDKDMNYLGQSSQMLPYSTKYYLANKKLDVTDGDGEPTEGEEEGDAPTTDDGIANPDGGGEDGIDNANANPGTGR